MEDPRTWDQLTAALAEVGLADPEHTWSELVARGLVVGGSGRRAQFERVVASVVAGRPATGASTSYAIAQELHLAGVSTSASSEIANPPRWRCRGSGEPKPGGGLVTRIRRVLTRR